MGALTRVGGGERLASLRHEFPQIHNWNRIYAIVASGDSSILVARPRNMVVEEIVDADLVKRITYLERVFSDLLVEHGTDHSKGRTFYTRVCAVISNVPRELCQHFTDTCPRCIERSQRTRSTAGLRPIITAGFNTRGQVDLIDFQSMPDGEFRFLLNYIDHGCKFLFSIPIVRKRASTPRRGEMRKRAHEQMSKAAASMKKAVIKRVGNEKVCEVGEVVHVPLKDMDKAKVDTGNLTGVIVQVDKGRSQARVAVKSGLLKSWYVYHRLGRVTGAGNNVELNGLTDALANWKTMPVIAEREAARNESMVGGQGKGDVTCNCRGPCNTKQCSCKKAGRICTSACHRNNMKCVNHDRGEK